MPITAPQRHVHFRGNPPHSLVLRNRADGKWWIDVPSGAGAYIVLQDSALPPAAGWQALPGIKKPLPKLEVFEAGTTEAQDGGL